MKEKIEQFLQDHTFARRGYMIFLFALVYLLIPFFVTAFIFLAVVSCIVAKFPEHFQELKEFFVDVWNVTKRAFKDEFSKEKDQN